jgi:signal transduction histidine kinase
MNKALLDMRVETQSPDLMVLGDNQGLLRLLSILIENATKYTPPGGAVTLSAARKQGRIVFSVIDTGVGIAPEHQSRIFDRFYRATPQNEAMRTGSGLGLSLAKWIAERHGTELTVQSKPGNGSRFSFSLECAPDNIEAVDAINQTSGKSVENSGHRSPQAI